METSSLLFIGYILHRVGDYLTQNEWMAKNKTQSWFPALVHATIYSLPFLFICFDPLWLVIWITHYLIDRYRLVTYWLKLVNWNWNSDNFGFRSETPKHLSISLMITADNTFHIIINTLCIYFANT